MKNRFSGAEFGEQVAIAKAEWYLPTIKPEEQIGTVIDEVQNPEILARATADQLNEYIVRLNMYNFFLQQELNKLNSKVKFYKSNIETIIGQNLGETPYTFFGEKRLYILASNSTATKMDQDLMVTEAKIELLRGYDRQINNLVESLEKLSYSRSKMHS